MRSALVLMALAMLAAGESVAAAASTRLATSDDALSFAVPAGWQVRELPGLKNRIASGTPAQGFAPNINVVDERAAMTIAQYQAANQAAMAKMMTDFKVIGSAPFATAAGVQGVRMVCESTQGQFTLRQVFYMLPGRGDTKYVVTASSLAGDGAAHDAVFDAAAASIVIK